MKTCRIFLLLFVCIITLKSHPQTQVTIGKSKETVFRVTPNRTGDLDELLPLSSILKDKKVAGMGEATHGSREFFNMKAKTFKFLATHCGYRVFSIEAAFDGTLLVNDYVFNGKGNAADAMRGMEYWIWDTDEVKDLIEWMKSFNENKPDNEKLKFYGFDCQTFKGPAKAMVSYVKEFDEPGLSGFLKGLSVLNDSSNRYFYSLNSGKVSRTGLEQIKGIISFLKTWFSENESSCTAHSGKSAYELARYNIRILEQVVLITGSPQKKQYYQRDSCMARNIQWISELEQSGVFASAHNGHISKAPVKPYSSGQSMGAYLDNIFGRDYYGIGFVFRQGGFQAMSPGSVKPVQFTVPSYDRNKLASELSNSGIESFFIDLRGSGNPLFSASGHAYNIGAGFMPEYWEKYSKPIHPFQEFDALVFISSVTAASPVIRITGK